MGTQSPGSERVILVNDRDEEIGTEEKLRAHQLNLMHRAFSVFLVNNTGHVLLQRRAEGKYHSAGLWSNTVCGHPRPGEPIAQAAARRLHEEMGVDCTLVEVAAFTYCLAVAEELTENEFDHVFIGCWDGTPHPDAAEVADWEWRAPEWLDRALRERPERFSRWLPRAWQAVRSEVDS
jgi:isopentenyl-diphosphate delta-isomerase